MNARWCPSASHLLVGNLVGDFNGFVERHCLIQGPMSDGVVVGVVDAAPLHLTTQKNKWLFG